MIKRYQSPWALSSSLSCLLLLTLSPTLTASPYSPPPNGAPVATFRSAPSTPPSTVFNERTSSIPGWGIQLLSEVDGESAITFSLRRGEELWTDIWSVSTGSLSFLPAHDGDGRIRDVDLSVRYGTRLLPSSIAAIAGRSMESATTGATSTTTETANTTTKGGSGLPENEGSRAAIDPWSMKAALISAREKTTSPEVSPATRAPALPQFDGHVRTGSGKSAVGIWKETKGGAVTPRAATET